MSTGGHYDNPDDPRPDRTDGYDDYGDGPPRRNPREAVRVRVMIPAIFLVFIGSMSVLYVGFNLVMLVSDPAGTLKPVYEMMEQFFKGQPQGLPPFDEFVEQYTPIYIAMFSVVILGSLLILLGGVQMIRLRGYGLALTGAITASIGLCTMNCFCLSLPFGIWALVVLMNADVKAAFRRPYTEPAA